MTDKGSICPCGYQVYVKCVTYRLCLFTIVPFNFFRGYYDFILTRDMSIIYAKHNARNLLHKILESEALDSPIISFQNRPLETPAYID